MYKLPDRIFTWVWNGDELAKIERSEKRSPGGIILSETGVSVDDRPAIAHFARLEGGIERNWLWLFPNLSQAIALRMLPRFIQSPETELIADTLPRYARPPQPCHIRQLSPEFLRSLDLKQAGIDEVWIGFEHKAYGRDRVLRLATDVIIPAAEFERVCAFS